MTSSDFSKEQFEQFDEETDFRPQKCSYYCEEDIVVSGISGRFPESDNVKELRDNLMNGINMVTADDRRWKPGFLNLPPKSGKLKEINKFDNEYFNLNAKHAEESDSQIRMLLECAYEAFADAGIPPESVSNWNTGVYVGICTMESTISIGEEGERMTGYKLIGLSRNMAPNRISYFFNLKGPSFSVDSACSSGLSCLDIAMMAIRNGQCDSALVCASNLCLHPVYTTSFLNLGMLSKDGKSAVFSKDANGYVRSEAVVAVLLQKASVAKRVYTTLVHIKTNTDGYKPQGITYPSPKMQIKLLKEVYAEANVNPSDLDYLETHGTGTPVGDRVEGNAVAQVFTKDRERPLLIGSSKSNIGHTESSSGLCSLTKIIIAMEEGIIPKNLNYIEPNPDVPALCDGRLKVVAENTPWKGGLVGLSAFGFGGVNVHVILRSNTKEKSPEDAQTDGQLRLFAFSGRTHEAVESMLSHLEKNSDPNLYGLLADMMNSPGKLHPYRGYTILNSTSPIRQIEKVKADKRPVWFIFAGMGSQWAGMGRDHMQLEVFHTSIMKSTEIMKPYGIDVYDLIMNGTAETFEQLLNNFIAIAAVQIALVDTLRVLGIEPDGMVGHSVGELGCAYADGCLDAEQTMISAYWRGKCVIDSKLPPGAMAAVGLTQDEVNRTAPAGVVAACHNAQDSITISGEAETVKAYVEQLKRKHIFARNVQSAGFAFHCYYMNDIGPLLLEKLKPVIPNPKQRSSKWISSSVPQSKWDSNLAMTCSGEYLVNNLTSPVLFYEAMDFVPSNAILIEVAPHCILQAILKRSLGPDATYLGTMKRNHPDNLEYFLTNVGMMYLNGMKPTISKLYPPITFPVPRGTPMISPYIKWNHSRNWKIPTIQGFCRHGLGIQRSFDISNQTSDDYYLIDHNIDGRILLPASAYLILAWKGFAKTRCNFIENQAVILENVTLHRATVLPKTGSVSLQINVAESSGTFEISENGTVLASGIAKAYNDTNNSKFITKPGVKNLALERKDIYKDLHLRGYKYGPNFQGIIGADLEGENFMVEWQDNWITFIDSMLQCAVLSSDSKLLRVPVRFRSVIIDPFRHRTTLEMVAENDCIPLVLNSRTNVISSGGIIIEEMVTNVINRQVMKQTPILEEYRFVPYQQHRCFIDEFDFENKLRRYSKICSTLIMKILQKHESQEGREPITKVHYEDKSQDVTEEDVLSKEGNLYLMRVLESIAKLSQDSIFDKTKVDIMLDKLKEEEDMLLDALLSEKILKPCVDLVFENTISKTPKIVEIEGNYPRLTKKLFSLMNTGLNPKTEYIVTHSNVEKLSTSRIPGVSYREWDVSNQALTGEGIDLVIARGLMTTESNSIELLLENIKDSMSSTGFLLLIEPRKDSTIFSGICSLKGKKNIQMSPDEIRDVFQKCELEIVAYQSDGIYQEMYLLRKTCYKAFEIIHIKEHIGSWLEELKSKLQDKQNNYGKTIWLISRDQPTNGILGLVNCLRLEQGGDKIRCVFFMESVHKSADLNLQDIVRKNLVMNIYKDGKWGSMRHLSVNTDIMKMVDSCFLNIRQKGDLSTLTWFESRLKPNETSNSEETICYNYYSALNFRDIMLATGRITVDALPKEAENSDCLLGLEFVGRNVNGRRIMGISKECFASEIVIDPLTTWQIPDNWTMEEAVTVPVVYTTVYYAFFIKGKLKSGDSILIHSGSGGIGQAAITVAMSKGCQIYTTVGTEEKRDFLKKRFHLKDEQIGNSRDSSFETWIRNKTNGKGVDYVLNSLAEDKFKASLRCLAVNGTFLEIGKYDFLMNNSLGTSMFLNNVNFLSVMLDGALLCPSEMRVISNFIEEGLKTGVIQPLTKTVFDKSNIEEAFQFMATGKHIGKIVIKFREEENNLAAVPKAIPMMAVPQIYAHPKKSFIITGGLGGFGLELTRWLIERKASHVILSSRSGIKTGYQRRCVHLWRNKGINVVINTSDITTEAGVTELISEASKHGPVGGIFHLAMVLKDALLENQTVEMFKEVLGPKVKAAHLLDQISRKKCPSLDWFVVFSSVACGRGNIGQTNYAYANSSMERICELRCKDNLPGLAIQWGPIGDVGIIHESLGGSDVTIAGTVSQRIQSCLEVLEKFMIQNSPVLSSIVLEETKNTGKTIERQNLLTNCCSILGIKDSSIVDQSLTLADFGIDSLMSVELRQILERDFQLFLSLQEVRELTLEKIQRISETISDTTNDNSEILSISKSSSSKSKVKEASRHRFSSEELTSLERISTLNDKKLGNPLFLIHGYENSMKIFDCFASKLKCPVFGLQCGSENGLKSIQEVAKDYFQRIRSIQANGPYHIAGYTFGAKIAVEIASQLQSKEKIGSLILIDGSHLYSDLLLAYQNKSKQEEEIEAEALCIFLDQFTNFNFQEVKNNLLSLKSSEVRLDFAENLAQNGYPLGVIKSAAKTLLNLLRLGYLDKERNTFRGNAVLMNFEEYKHNDNIAMNYQEVVDGKLKIKTFKGNCDSIIKEPIAVRLSNVINEYLNL